MGKPVAQVNDMDNKRHACQPQERFGICGNQGPTSMNIFRIISDGHIGSGKGGRVQLVQKKQGVKQRVYFAVKTFVKKDPAHGRHEVAVLQRLSQLTQCLFPRLHWVERLPDVTRLVMDYYCGGSLRKWGAQYGFTQHQARFYGAEILSAITFLHRQHIVHRDVTLNNVVLTGNFHTVLVDFGLALEIDTVRRPRSWQQFNTKANLAPELYNGNPWGYTFEPDYFSFGLILCDLSMEEYNMEISDREECCVEFTAGLHPDLKALVRGLLRKDPRHRYGEAEAKSSPYFEGVNWEAVEKRQVPAPLPAMMVDLLNLGDADDSPPSSPDRPENPHPLAEERTPEPKEPAETLDQQSNHVQEDQGQGHTLPPTTLLTLMSNVPPTSATNPDSTANALVEACDADWSWGSTVTARGAVSSTYNHILTLPPTTLQTPKSIGPSTNPDSTANVVAESCDADWRSIVTARGAVSSTYKHSHTLPPTNLQTPMSIGPSTNPDSTATINSTAKAVAETREAHWRSIVTARGAVSFTYNHSPTLLSTTLQTPKSNRPSISATKPDSTANAVAESCDADWRSIVTARGAVSSTYKHSHTLPPTTPQMSKSNVATTLATKPDSTANAVAESCDADWRSIVTARGAVSSTYKHSHTLSPTTLQMSKSNVATTLATKPDSTANAVAESCDADWRSLVTARGAVSSTYNLRSRVSRGLRLARACDSTTSSQQVTSGSQGERTTSSQQVTSGSQGERTTARKRFKFN